MKKLIILSSVILGLTACSTAEKMEMDKAEGEATEAVENAKADAEKTAEDKAQGGSQAACTLDKDTRVIEVKKTESGGCELFYTKFGEAKSVATSGFGTQYCEEVKDRIQSNLNKAGFACK